MTPNAIPEQIVAAMDKMLLAIGQWQAEPTLERWTLKIVAIRKYLAMIDENPQYAPAT